MRLLVCAFFACVVSAQAASYSITDLGTGSGTESFAFDVNIHGDVVGFLRYASGEEHAFLYQNGTMTDLGVLEAGHTFSQAFGVNDFGEVVGISTNPDPDGFVRHSRPFTYSGGSMSLVGSFGGDFGWANDINEAGQIVGISAYSNGITHAFVESNGTMTDLGSYGGSYDYSIAYGINGVGSVAGYSTINSPDFYEAFLHHSGNLENLGNLGGSSRGFAINDSNQVIGDSIIDAAGHQRAFLWDNGVMNDLGVIGGAVSSQGLDINNHGHVVGTLVFDLNNGDLNHGFLHQDGQIIDVNTLLPPNSGWILRDAQAINELGQIVGFGEINGQKHAYLLTPVPEPTTLVLLFATGLMTSPFWLKRKKRATNGDSNSVFDSVISVVMWQRSSTCGKN